jgi:hypothetical protein
MLLMLLWRRWRQISRLPRRDPYAMLVLLWFTIAFSTPGNLKLLVRERTTSLPLAQLPLYLARRSPRRRATRDPQSWNGVALR